MKIIKTINPDRSVILELQDGHQLYITESDEGDGIQVISQDTDWDALKVEQNSVNAVQITIGFDYSDLEPKIQYCSCGSTKVGIYKRMPTPGGGKQVMPSYICPDCEKYRSLDEFLKGEPENTEYSPLS